MKLDQFLRRSSASHPQRAAVIDQESRISYSELNAVASALASSLQRLNLANGSRVGLLMENSIDYVISFFAITSAGFVVVPLDTSANGETLRYILADCEIKVLIAQSRFRRQLKVLFDGEQNLKILLCDSQLNFAADKVQTISYGPLMALEAFEVAGEREAVRVSEAITFDRNGKKHELAAIFYTSGSTGTPKGVMLSHLNLMSNTLATIEYLRLTEIDRTLVILPFYYIYGNSLLLTNIACGACLVIDNRFLYPETVLNTLEEHQCTGLSGVPSNFMI
ncbi:MAG: class I adenylate-forming enzyme family protein, partial [Candidatus Zixiibacteriota bacterium]